MERFLQFSKVGIWAYANQHQGWFSQDYVSSV